MSYHDELRGKKGLSVSITLVRSHRLVLPLVAIDGESMWDLILIFPKNESNNAGHGEEKDVACCGSV